MLARASAAYYKRTHLKKYFLLGYSEHELSAIPHTRSPSSIRFSSTSSRTVFTGGAGIAIAVVVAPSAFSLFLLFFFFFVSSDKGKVCCCRC